ncbi:hypothetical protein Tco_0309878 [Tanacetum coccineum]
MCCLVYTSLIGTHTKIKQCRSARGEEKWRRELGFLQSVGACDYGVCDILGLGASHWMTLCIRVAREGADIFHLGGCIQEFVEDTAEEEKDSMRLSCQIAVYRVLRRDESAENVGHSSDIGIVCSIDTSDVEGQFLQLGIDVLVKVGVVEDKCQTCVDREILGTVPRLDTYGRQLLIYSDGAREYCVHTRISSGENQWGKLDSALRVDSHFSGVTGVSSSSTLCVVMSLKTLCHVMEGEIRHTLSLGSVEDERSIYWFSGMDILYLGEECDSCLCDDTVYLRSRLRWYVCSSQSDTVDMERAGWYGADTYHGDYILQGQDKIFMINETRCEVRYGRGVAHNVTVGWFMIMTDGAVYSERCLVSSAQCSDVIFEVSFDVNNTELDDDL